MVTLDISYVPKFLKLCQAAKLTANLVGASGIGKTETVEAYRDSVEALFRERRDPKAVVGLKVTCVSTVSAVEFVGVLMPDSATGTCKFYPRVDVPWEGNDLLPEFGIWFFDEVDTIPSNDVGAALMTLFESRRIGDKKLKPGWVFITAMNGRTVNVYATELAAPLKRRMCHAYVTTSGRALRKYAVAHRWNKTIMDMLDDDPDAFTPRAHDFDDLAVPVGPDGSPENPSPRQGEYYRRIIEVVNASPEEFAPVMFHAMQGVLGLQRASQESARILTAGKVPTISAIKAGRASTMIPPDRFRHFLALPFAMMGTVNGQNGESRFCLSYLKQALDAGVSSDLVRLGVQSLGQVFPEVWGHQWATELI